MELEYMLYFLLLISVGFNFYNLFTNLGLRDELKDLKKTQDIFTDEEMLEVAKKYGNNAQLNNINQAALNIWYNWLIRQIKLLKSAEIKFNIID